MDSANAQTAASSAWTWSCFSLVGKKFTLFTYVVSQLYIYNFLARSASYWTVHKFGDGKNPKQHLTTEDWARIAKKIL